MATAFCRTWCAFWWVRCWEVGRGFWEPEQVQAILDSRDRKQAGPTAPPEGLCLMKVDY